MKKTALIVGADGQDGSYLFEQLQAEGYDILGIDKNNARSNRSKKIGAVDITSPEQVAGIVSKYKPNEIYYLAAFHQSSEDRALDDAELFRQSYLINTHSLINFLDAMSKHSKKSRLFFAASSHIFGNPGCDMQDEQTPLNPVCVYGITKTMGLQACRFYRRQHSLFASVGILYNHESPRRAEKFVTRKIVKTAVAIKRGRAKKLTIGDITAKVDWGYAPDYINAMRLILQHNKPDDFIIASGKLKTIKQFIETVFKKLDLNWKEYVIESPSLIRKKQKNNLAGDISKIKKEIGWKPEVGFDEMIEAMIKAELKHES